MYSYFNWVDISGKQNEIAEILYLLLVAITDYPTAPSTLLIKQPSPNRLKWAQRVSDHIQTSMDVRLSVKGIRLSFGAEDEVLVDLLKETSMLWPSVKVDPYSELHGPSGSDEEDFDTYYADYLDSFDYRVNGDNDID